MKKNGFTPNHHCKNLLLKLISQTDGSGFTLIELLASAAIIGAISVVAVAMFFSTLRGGTKSSTITKVKQNGEFALNAMKFAIRNAISVDSCTSDTLTISLRDGQIIYSLVNDQITSNSSNFLTSSNYKAEALNFNCDILVPGSVSFSFILDKKNSSDDFSPQTFSTTVSLRSY